MCGVKPPFQRRCQRARHRFVPLRRQELDLVFALQHERVVARDNTVNFGNRVWQLERSKLRGPWRARVTVHEHLDQTLSITFRPHLVGRYAAHGQPAMEMTPPRKSRVNRDSHRGLEKSAKKPPDSPTFPQLLLLTFENG